MSAESAVVGCVVSCDSGGELRGDSAVVERASPPSLAVDGLAVGEVTAEAGPDD
jgi:hypothetical protein